MRYVDTGSRDPKEALGSWLGDVLLGPAPVASLRAQTGFFGSDALGYFEGAFKALGQSDGQTRILVGSNDGQTPRQAIADLLKIAGQPRSGLGIGVVSYQSGFFHPKVFHFQRADGSSTAYVGSANLTRSGATSLHVEAGVILDSNQGDSQSVLDSIADAIDAWFTEGRPGLYEVTTDADLDPLVAAGVLGLPSPTRAKRTVKPTKGGGQKTQPSHSLKPLVVAPNIQTPLPEPAGTPAPSPSGDDEPTMTPDVTVHDAGGSRGEVVEHWSKDISPSDAQRRAGHQSAALALTQGDYRHKIDQTTYFRTEMFGDETWALEESTGRKPVDAAYVSMRVTVDGVDHGNVEFRIAHAPHRESQTNSPTTYIHLEPLLGLFAKKDMTGRKVTVERFEDGTYAFTIS
ncbi:phospholipase D-like domain-containing protein [Pimelobacter simplex]|uniref:phospholipase D-like domain-containing protein n=1 Tax=Nocardioides simplex TaxID=2045 RepID=UPI003AAE5C75